MIRARSITFVLMSICLLTPLSASAVTYYMYCSLVRTSNDFNDYVSLVRVEFDPDDPPYRLVGGSRGVDGTDNLSDNWQEWVGKPTIGWSVNLDYQGEYDTSRTARSGGCDTPFISVLTYGTGEGTTAGTTLCWSPWICHLSVYIDTDGSITPTAPSGDCDCFACTTLTAVPLPGFDWGGWTGDVNSIDPVITVCMGGASRSVTANFMTSQPPPPPPTDIQDACNPLCTPIIFNLGNGDYQLTGRSDPVLFDISATGTPSRIGWTARGTEEAFLWLDRNQNGRVDDGSELFGNATFLRNGQRAPNGFVALAEYDKNGDGLIDANDPVWNSLMLWVDRNHDGIAQLNEIQPIAASSITAIELSYHWTGRHDQFGNVLRYEGHLREGNHSRAFYDILFVAVP